MKSYQYVQIVIILVFICEPEYVASMSLEEKNELRKKVLEMFHHGYRSYMDYAYPADELMPLSCKGRYRGTEPSRGDVDDTLGDFSLTLIDTLDTLVILGELEEFEEAVRLVINGVSFDSDIVVSVFETNIRVLGGLLGGHVMARYLKSHKKGMEWYRDELLEKAKDIGYRLLPAFNTTTGMPYPRVNLRYGVKHHLSRTGSEKDTCTACAGTMILEFSALSRLSGDPIFEEKAHKAMEYLWKSRHRASDLVGTVINIHNGDWVRRDSGVGAGIDSYYEYVLKAYILLGDETYLDRFNKHYAAIRKYVTQGPMLVDVHMHKPFTNSKNFMDALLAFWPGLLTLIGDIKPAVQTHEMLYQVIQRHSFLPEAFTTDFRIHWAQHPLRPEFLESTYFLYKATGDPHYLHVGKEVLENLDNLARVKCGFAAIKDVTTGAHEDQMDSYVLAETFKYLYLLFSEPEDLVINVDNFVFTTEAHLLPLSLSIHSNSSSETKMPGMDSLYDEGERLYEHTCPNANHVFESNYVKTFRDPLKNMVDSSCPASQARCQVPVIRMPFVKGSSSSCKPKFVLSKEDIGDHVDITEQSNIDPSNRKRLRASEFVAGNKDQLETLAKMGISVITMTDGRVQLLHTASEAASAEDAEDGMQFMQEMIELSKSHVNDASHEPHVVQLVTPPYLGAVLYAGPAQFGYDLKTNSGIKGMLVVADPIRACEPLSNAELVRDHIVIMERGDCMFVDKARLIESAGALAGIVIDNHEGTSATTQSLFAMSGDGKDDITIPVLFLFHKEGQELLDAAQKSKDLLVYLGHKAKQPAEIMRELVFDKSSKSESNVEQTGILESGDMLPGQSPPSEASSQSQPILQDALAKVFKSGGIETEQRNAEDREQHTATRESFIHIITGPDGVKKVHLHLDKLKIEKEHAPTLLAELVSQLNAYTNFFSLGDTSKYVNALKEMLDAVAQNDYSVISAESVKMLQRLNESLKPKELSAGEDDTSTSASTLKEQLKDEMESVMDEYIVAELKKVIDEASAFRSEDKTQSEATWVATKVFSGQLESRATDEELSSYGLLQPKDQSKQKDNKFRPYLPPNVMQAPDWLSLSRGQLMLAKDGNIYADLRDSYWELADVGENVEEERDGETDKSRVGSVDDDHKETGWQRRAGNQPTTAAAAGVNTVDGTSDGGREDTGDGPDCVQSKDGTRHTIEVDATSDPSVADGVRTKDAIKGSALFDESRGESHKTTGQIRESNDVASKQTDRASDNGHTRTSSKDGRDEL